MASSRIRLLQIRILDEMWFVHSSNCSFQFGFRSSNTYGYVKDTKRDMWLSLRLTHPYIVNYSHVFAARGSIITRRTPHRTKWKDGGALEELACCIAAGFSSVTKKKTNEAAGKKGPHLQLCARNCKRGNHNVVLFTGCQEMRW